MYLRYQWIGHVILHTSQSFVCARIKPPGLTGECLDVLETKLHVS